MNSLDVQVDIPPWLRTDLVLAPVNAPFGYYRKRKPFSATLDQIQEQLKHDSSRQIHMVWTPASHYLQPVSQVEELRDVLLQRDKLQYGRSKTSRTFNLTGPLIILLILPIWLQHWPDWMYIPLIIVGLFPLGYVFWKERKQPAAKEEGYWEQRALDDVYTFWLQHQLQLSSWLVVTSLVIIGLIEYSLGLGISIENAGLVKNAVWERGEVWRLITGAFLHGSLPHLAYNSLALLWVGKHMEALIPHSYVIAIFLLTALAGSISSLIFLLHTNSIGASGGVMGMFGVMTAYAWNYRDKLPRQLTEDLIWNFVFVAAYGVASYFAIDNAAHAGGFFTGLLLGAILNKRSAGHIRWKSQSCLPTILATVGLTLAVCTTIGMLLFYR